MKNFKVFDKIQENKKKDTIIKIKDKKSYQKPIFTTKVYLTNNSSKNTRNRNIDHKFKQNKKWYK